MTAVFLLAPMACIIALIVTKDRLQATLSCLLILFLASIIDLITSTGGHAHNPLGRFTGTILLFIFVGPLVLIGLCFKKPKPKKQNKSKGTDQNID